jgi:phytoene synthase
MDQVVAHSRDSITVGSKSFRAASRLFDRRTREEAWLLYAWCRHCDDQVDGQDHGHGQTVLSPDEQRSRLERLREQTREALAGRPVSDPAFAAFQRVGRELPQRFPLALLDGFAMDVEARRYATLEETLDYCWHVAGVVGVMMTHVMGARDGETLRRAQDLGLAFQLTNIARDVVEDAQNGRVYLPAAWLEEAGVAPVPAAVAAAQDRAAVHATAARLVAAAEPYYDSAREGLAALPFRSALAVAAARGVYREIGRKLTRRGSSAWDRRVVVGRPMKLWLFGRALLIAARTRLPLATAPRPAGLWSKL